MVAHRLSLACASLIVLAVPSLALADGKTPAPAQDPDILHEDTVFLRNGTYFSGKIVEENATRGVTIELENGQKKVIPNNQIKRIDRAPPPPAKPEPKPEKKSDKKPEKKPAPEPVKEASSSAPWVHPDAVSPGLLFEIGAARSRMFSVALGFRAIVDVGLGGATYLRFEPGLSTFKRSTSATTPVRIDVPVDPTQSTVITVDTISNDVRLIQFSSRALIGHDFSDGMLSMRAGGIVGFMTGKTPAAQCSAGVNGDVRQSGAMFGGSIVPIALRPDQGRRFELGTFIDIESIVVPICNTPQVDSIQARRGTPVFIVPGVTGQRVFAMAFGLQAGTVFW